MFAKRLLQKAVYHSQNLQRGSLMETDLDLRIAFHYGVPSTASLLAFDPVQRLLAVGTLDGRIKVIGGDGIEGLLISPKQLPYKNIEFFQNQGHLVSILNDNDIQVWNLETRCLACCLQWETNITAFAVIHGSNFMYIGDEYGLMSVMKYNVEDGKLLQLPYHVSANSINEAIECTCDQPIVGVLPQPRSFGNRVLIAYQSGLLVLRDVSETRIIFAGGGKDLQLRDEIVESSSEIDKNSVEDTSDHLRGEKEISALCWASSDGSILAVGYIDGDILFWNMSSAASIRDQLQWSNNVVKLRLSSAEKRLPVIVLQWSATSKSRNANDGQLFIYGGDEIGSEEVLTVLTLEWSSGVETLKCVGRADLTLSGSFADMILLPSDMAAGHKADIFVLTNPGQLQFYDDATLSSLRSQQDEKPFSPAMEFPGVIPMTGSSLTVAKLFDLTAGENSLKTLSEITSVMKFESTPTPSGATNWPLTGGVPSQFSTTQDNVVKRLFVAGYSNGSVRIWDATYPVLSFIYLLEAKVQGIKVAGSSAPLSEMDICFISSSLVVGNECGLVRIYNLKGCTDGTNFHFVTETNHEVHSLNPRKGPQCIAIFCLLNSSVQALRFVSHGTKLLVGFKCGRVAVINITSLSLLFFTDDVSCSNSPVISVSWKELKNTRSLVKNPKHPGKSTLEEVVFILTKDSKICIIDGLTGNTINPCPWSLKKETVAISMYVIESGNTSASMECNEKLQEEDAVRKHEDMSDKHGDSLLDSFVLLCCTDSLRLYSAKSVIQGNNKPIRKVKHTKPCSWTTTFKKDEKLQGLVLLFQTGDIEIRSVLDLELVKESSLVSILRWNFKANMDKTMSSSDNGQITLANGCELAFISVLASENDLRIPESLPCLHDKVLAAAADAALNASQVQRKKGTAPGILGGIVKGLKGGKAVNPVDLYTKSAFDHLEDIFLKSPHSGLSTSMDPENVLELDIDDIEIDEPQPASSTSSHDSKSINQDKESDRERLFQGGTGDVNPRVRTPQEIRAAYRKAGDASTVAAQAKNKLMERQEKLERISRRTEELQSGAEDFASLANELVKTLENRKWWQR